MIVAGLQVFTSLKMTAVRRGRHKDLERDSKENGRWVRDTREGIWIVGERRNIVKVKSLQAGVNREGGRGGNWVEE